MEQIVNDVHSRLNATRVREIVRPTGIDDVRDVILRVKREPDRVGGLAMFARELGWSVTAHTDSNALIALDKSSTGNRAIVTGEEIIEANTTKCRST